MELDSLIAPLDVPPPRSEPRRPRQPWHWRLGALLSAYLPLLLMALLALATWWLVKNTPPPLAAAPEGPLQHEPDYLMQRFTMQRFAPDGRLRVQIAGTQLRHYPDTDTLEIDGATIVAHSPDGSVTRASARSALANGDATEVQLRGGAHVVREGAGTRDAIEFDSEFLHAFLSTERVRSHLPVRLRQGTSELRAAGIDYDNLARAAKLAGPVRARFDPPAKR